MWSSGTGKSPPSILPLLPSVTTQVQDKANRYRKTSCRYCEAPLAEPFLELGTMSLANSFLKESELRDGEFACPLSVTFCPKCRLVQLTHVVPPDLMFSNYLYVSSTTQTFRKHFADYAKEAKQKLGKKEGKALAVDIGSNDGLLTSCYQQEGMTAVGVEPAKNLSRAANEAGVPTVNDYFGQPAVEEILKRWGPADIVSGNNVFAHIDNIPDVLTNVNRLLNSNGIFVIEFPYLVTMLEKMLFDMIYHEHLSYIAVQPLRFILKKFNLEIFSIESVPSHGGSLRVYIQKKTGGRTPSPEVTLFLEREVQGGYGSIKIYQDFAKRVHQVKKDLKDFVEKVKSEGGTLSGYGAAAKGNTLINFCEFNRASIEYLVDDNPLKQNLFSPGAHIPVVSSRHLFEHPTQNVILFAWNFAADILKKLAPLRTEGVRFLTPLPEPKLV